MGLTILIVVLSIAVYEPTAEKAEDGIVFLAITLAAMMAGLMMNAVVSNILFKQLTESSREKGQLDLAKYQTILIMRLLPPPKRQPYLGSSSFSFLQKPQSKTHSAWLYFAPTAIFYLILFSAIIQLTGKA